VFDGVRLYDSAVSFEVHSFGAVPVALLLFEAISFAVVPLERVPMKIAPCEAVRSGTIVINVIPFADTVEPLMFDKPRLVR
jgi:hypothetical protein